MPQASTINSSVIYVETQTATYPPPPQLKAQGYM